MQLDLRELLHFAVIAQEGSVTAASLRLSIAQPWLSQRLKSLERRLGILLVTRQGRGIALTPEGERIYAIACELLSIETRIADEAQQINACLASRISIGAPPYSSRVPAIGEILRGLSAALPALSIETDVGWSPHLIERVLSGDLDAAFVTEPFNDTGLKTCPVSILQRYLVFEPDDPLFDTLPVHPEDLAERMVEVFPKGVNLQLFDTTFGHLSQSNIELVPTGFDGVPLRTTQGVGPVVRSFFSPVLDHEKPGHRALAGSPLVQMKIISRCGDGRPVLRQLQEIAAKAGAK